MIKRYVTFFLAITCFLSASSQKNLSINTPFIDFLDNYTQTTGIQFGYNPTMLAEVDLIPSQENKNTIPYLKEILLQANIEYKEIDDKHWLLKKINSPDAPSSQAYDLTGYVREGDAEPLISALIFTAGAEHASLTDESGKFTLEIPDRNDYEICCQYLGYEINCIKSTEIKNNTIDFIMKPKVQNIDGILIKTKRLKFNIDPIDDSEVMLIKNTALNNATLGNDPLKSVELLSGVDATNDLSSALRIRASDDGQSLITLDNIPIYNPESSFGIFSVINPLVVESSRLYKNALPLEFGEFTGAYLACDGLINLEEKTQFDLNVNTLKSSASIKIPINNKSQFSAAVRKSNGNISNKQFYNQLQEKTKKEPQDGQLFVRPVLLDSELENNFGDLYFNFKQEHKNNSQLSSTIFLNRDFSTSSFVDTSTLKRGNSDNFLKIKEVFSQDRNKTNFGFSFNYKKSFANNNNLIFQVYSSQYDLSDGVDASIILNTKNREKVNSYGAEFLNKISDSKAKIQYQTNPKKLISVKSGLDFRRLSSDLTFQSQEDVNFAQALTIPSITPYLGLNINYEEKLILTLGNRTSIIRNQKAKAYWSPRVNLAIKAAEGFYFKASASHNEQYFRPIEIEKQLGLSVSTNILSNERNIPLLKSNQITSGFNYKNGIVSLNADFYYRINNGIIEQVLQIPGINDNEDNLFGNNNYELINGLNRVIGFDLTTMVNYKNMSSLLSYSYSKSEDRFKDFFNSQFIPSQNNRLHQANAFASYNFKNWTFSSTYIYGTGLYTLNRLELVENIIRQNVTPDNLLKKLPDYKRLDVATSYKIPAKFGKLYLDLSIYNVLDNKNINSEISIYSIEGNNKKALGASQINLLSRIWSVGLRLSI